MTKTQAARWVKRAKTMSCAQLRTALGESAEGTQLNFFTTTKQAEVVKDILERHKETFGATNRADVLFSILNEWSSSRSDVRARLRSLSKKAS